MFYKRACIFDFGPPWAPERFKRTNKQHTVYCVYAYCKHADKRIRILRKQYNIINVVVLEKYIRILTKS